jgi:hypothetical protein
MSDGRATHYKRIEIPNEVVKMKKRIWLPKVLSYFMIVLMVLAVGSMVLLPWIVSSYLDYAFKMTGSDFVRNYFLSVLYISGVLAIFVLYELRLIFRTCTDSNPFVMRNVISLKRIGFAALAIGMVFVTKAVMYLTFMTLVVIFVFALAALFCFVLADVFEEAIHYKNENDLTI